MSFIFFFFFDVTSVVDPDPEIFHEFLHLILRLLLSIFVMVSAHFWLTALVHSSSMVNQLFVMVQGVWKRILQIVLFWIVVFWKILCWLPANNNLWEKLVSSSPKIFDDSHKVTSVVYFVADFNLFSCEFHNDTFTVLHWIILY